MKGIVEIVFDSKKRKLRACYQGSWVRFPNNLRIEGARYSCDLQEGKSGSWIATGTITRLNAADIVRESVKPKKIKKSKSYEDEPVSVFTNGSKRRLHFED